MEIVFSMPPIPQEKVLDFALVPTYLKSEAELAQLQGQDDEEDDDDAAHTKTDSALRATITPAVLLLTRRNLRDDDEEEDATGQQFSKHLKIVRCPAMDMANWALEVGTLPDPRLASEVLPGASRVTVCSFENVVCFLRYNVTSYLLTIRLVFIHSSVHIRFCS